MKKNTILILSLCGLFLFYKYIAQLFPALIGSEFMQHYGYDGVMLAIMASSYYYSYSIMQLVAGYTIDRFDVKTPMFLALILMSLMIFLFTVANSNFYVMCLSRALIGVGASFATVVYMKCAALYTTPKTFGIISSFLATATMLGAACGSAPIALLFEKSGWQQGLTMIALLGLLMALCVLFVMKPRKNNASVTPSHLKFSNIKNVLAKKENWLLLLYSGLTFSPVAVLGGLWGVPFLMTKFSVTTAHASFFLTVMFIGHAVGSPCWAVLSLKLNKKLDIMHCCNIISLMALLAIIYSDTPFHFSLILFFIFGFSVGGFMLSFQLCREVNALYMIGLAVAFINSGEGIVSALVEPLIGYLLDVAKTRHIIGVQDYQTALWILPICYILSSATLLFLKPKKCVSHQPQLVGA